MLQTATATTTTTTTTLIGQLCYRKISKQFVLSPDLRLPGKARLVGCCLWLRVATSLGVKIVCDRCKLCNYSAYARLSKLNIQINSVACFGFTVRRLIDFYLCCACVCSCSISTARRMRNMATCPTTHTRAQADTALAGNGPQHGTADILNQLSGCKRTTATGNAS